MASITVYFNASLNANNMYFDTNYLDNPVVYKHKLSVQNQSAQALYCKLVNSLNNWSTSLPTGGTLGVVSAGATNWYDITLYRSRPSGETTDTGYLKLEVYSDSGYSTLVGYQTLGVTAYFENLENFTTIQLYNFDDGTSQGWNGGEVSSDYSIEGGGYSYKVSAGGNQTVTKNFYRVISFPNTNTIRVNAYFLISYLGASKDYDTWINNLKVTVNDNTILLYPGEVFHWVNELGVLPWKKICFDVSSYKNQSATLKIEWTYTGEHAVNYANFYWDRIIVAGK